ncbi:hypothetical protein P7K49_038107, partial [Saguinus oedipus]
MEARIVIPTAREPPVTPLPHLLIPLIFSASLQAKGQAVGTASTITIMPGATAAP